MRRRNGARDGDESAAVAGQEAGKAPVEADPDAEAVSEFGGPLGCLLIMLLSHATVYYIWICLEYYGACLAYPTGLADVVPFLGRMVGHVVDGAAPSWYAASLYVLFVAFQALLAVTMPGVMTKGLPVPSEGNRQLLYNCNGVYSWYATLATVAALHYFHVIRLSEVIVHLGAITTCSIIFSDVLAVAAYVSAVGMGKEHRMSGNLVYDFFMGAWLNPRIGTFDLKFWGETRVAWLVLFILTMSAAATELERDGAISMSMYFILVAHGLYCNAVMKGEECIPPTWDIYYEKWGWMLIFWNFAGVPFVYCAPALYILKRGGPGSALGPIDLPLWYFAALFTVLIVAYYVWDTSQSQKSRFRLMQRGAYVPRNTFPQLPWGTLKDPKVLETAAGSTLLIDGWWAYARKIHYSTDICMAFSWALCCGFDHALPYFYPTFFLSMILHRYTRDVARCQRKYQEDWDRYTAIVPYAFIPYVF